MRLSGTELAIELLATLTTYRIRIRKGEFVMRKYLYKGRHRVADENR